MGRMCLPFRAQRLNISRDALEGLLTIVFLSGNIPTSNTGVAKCDFGFHSGATHSIIFAWAPWVQRVCSSGWRHAWPKNELSLKPGDESEKVFWFSDEADHVNW